jgi:DNA polymerase II small subunit
VNDQRPEEQLRTAVAFIIRSGLQLAPDALAFLRELVTGGEIDALVKSCVDAALTPPAAYVIITKEHLVNALQAGKEPEYTGKRERTTSTGIHVKPYASGVETNLIVLSDPTDKRRKTGELSDFINYFRDRFTKTRRILKERVDLQDTLPIAKALELPEKTKVRIIGIVTEKTERKNRIFLTIEDDQASMRVLVPMSSERRVYHKAQRIFLDQVLCVQAVKSSSTLFIAVDVINPEIPDRTPTTAAEDVAVALLSDLHIGSREFLDSQFSRFIQWLKGEVGNTRQTDIARRVKYVVITGDLVDGIGVYPGQETDLLVSDVYKQYTHAAKILEQIPEYVEIIVIPGNHDATRQALPQPAIPKKYAEAVYELGRVKMLGNPSRLTFHGVNFLLCHGRSLDDVIGSVPDVTYQNLETSVTTAMKYLLKARHLAPIFGSKTAIAPEDTDALVIDHPPDVFHAGHVHVFGYETYRGTLIVNSGTFQNQTAFQKRMDLRPTPGIVPVVNLKTRQLTPIRFQ